MYFKLRMISVIFSQIMGFVYAVAGIFFIVYDFDLFGISKSYRMVLGIILLVYGIFRIYRAIKAIRIKNEN